MARTVAFICLVVVPAVEIFVIIVVAGAIGWTATLLALVAGALLGGYVMRRAGAAWWRALRGRVAAGGATASSPADGSTAASAALLFVAGLLLFVPGFITDAVGLLMLAPPVRAGLQAVTAAWFVRRFTEVTGPSGTRIWSRQGRVVRGQVVRDDGPPGGAPGRPGGGPPQPLQP